MQSLAGALTMLAGLVVFAISRGSVPFVLRGFDGQSVAAKAKPPDL